MQPLDVLGQPTDVLVPVPARSLDALRDDSEDHRTFVWLLAEAMYEHLMAGDPEMFGIKVSELLLEGYGV